MIVCISVGNRALYVCFCMIQSDRKSVKTVWKSWGKECVWNPEGEEDEREWVSHYTTWWGCSTVRTIVSLQRLWRENREWSGLDNATDSMVFGELLRIYICHFLAVLQLQKDWLIHRFVLMLRISGNKKQFVPFDPPSLPAASLLPPARLCCSPWPFSSPSPPPSPPPSLPPGTVKDVTLHGLWLSLGARRSPSPRLWPRSGLQGEACQRRGRLH